MMRRVLAVKLAIGLLGAGVIAMSATSASAATAKPLIVGAAVALTGPQAAYDTPPLISAEIAAADINRRGGIMGRQIKVVRYDMKSDRTLGPTAALDAISDGAEVLLVSCDFDVGSPAALAAQKKGVVSMSLCAGSPQFGPQGIGPLAFTAGMAAQTEAAGGAQWAYKKGWRKAYILEDSSVDYLKNWSQGFEDSWIKLAGKANVVGKDTFLNSDPSIATQITRIKALDTPPDFIALPSYPPGGASAIRQLRAAGIDFPIIACVALDGTYWLNAVPGLKNFYVTDYGSYVGNDKDPRINALYKKYKLKNKGKPPTFSYYVRGYGAMEALAKGIQGAKSTNGVKVQKALERFRNVPLLTGPTTFTNVFHISFTQAVTITAIQNGKPVYADRIVPKFIPKPRR